MSLKINNTKQEAPEFVYPLAFKLKGSELVVVFTAYKTGLVVSRNSAHRIGYWSDAWQPHTDYLWEPISITIEAP